MISTDFAPNETQSDAWKSLITLAAPWRWKRGGERGRAVEEVGKFFPGSAVTPFLSGRGALAILLRELDFPEGSQVIVQGYTCEAVVVPVLHCKLQPVYADIEKETFSMDCHDLLKKITPRTRAIILQHTYGLVPAHRDRVLQLAKDKKILVIEDLAHGFDPAFWQRKRLSDSQVLTLSFGRSKALSSVFGGALVTGNSTLNGKIRRAEAKLEYPGMGFIAKLLFYKPLSIAVKSTYNIGFFGKILHKTAHLSGLMVAEISKKEKAGNYDPYLEKKYPNALAILLLAQLDKYSAVMKMRKESTLLYSREFPLSVQPSYGLPRYPVLVENKTKLTCALARKNIYLGTWYSQPVAPGELKLDRVGYTMGSCPVSEEVCKKIVNLPTCIPVEQAKKVASLVKENYGY